VTAVKTNIPGFVKDERTGIVTNVDMAGLTEYKNKKAQVKRMKALEEVVRQLEIKLARLEGQLCGGNCPCKKSPVLLNESNNVGC
jgi:hypothetical protein